MNGLGGEGDLTTEAQRSRRMILAFWLFGFSVFASEIVIPSGVEGSAVRRRNTMSLPYTARDPERASPALQRWVMPGMKRQSAPTLQVDAKRRTADPSATLGMTIFVRTGSEEGWPLPREIEQSKDVDPECAHEVPIPRRHVENDAAGLGGTMEEVADTRIKERDQAAQQVNGMDSGDDEEEARCWYWWRRWDSICCSRRQA